MNLVLFYVNLKRFMPLIEVILSTVLHFFPSIPFTIITSISVYSTYIWWELPMPCFYCNLLMDSGNVLIISIPIFSLSSYATKGLLLFVEVFAYTQWWISKRPLVPLNYHDRSNDWSLETLGFFQSIYSSVCICIF